MQYVAQFCIMILKEITLVNYIPQKICTIFIIKIVIQLINLTKMLQFLIIY